MLDYTQKLTSEEIWQDCLEERVMQVMRFLRGGFDGMELSFDSCTPLDGKNALLTVCVTGLDFPLVYDFNVAAIPGCSFHATPANDEFMMMNNPHPEGYELAEPGTGTNIAHWATDIFLNYRNEQSTAQPLDDRVMRAEYYGYKP